MKKLTTFLVLALFATQAAMAGVPQITDADTQRAVSLVSQMTLKEKCGLIGGFRDDFYTYPIERLGIPSILLSDGPQGVRKLGKNIVNSTYYPCGIALAASFNRNIAAGVGTGIGYDAKARGVGVMLCPGVNIYRNALCGRNFEYFGEDPYLASETAVSYITGMQEQGVMSTIKHFAVNNQEYARHWVSSNIDERTLHEIYLETFRKAVEQAQVGSIMTSYNPINGMHAAEHPELIKGVIRGKWGFKGIVMSDWVSTYSPIASATSGLDLEMPRNYALTYENLKPLIDNGVVLESEIDEKCINILQTFIAYGFLDKPQKDSSIPEDYDVSRSLAYSAALEGPVLLKNNGVLPLKGGSYVVCGPNADYIPFGGGSGAMYPFAHRTTTLYQGMNSLGKKYKTQLRTSIPQAKELEKVDALIIAVGFNRDTEKENADRTYSLPRGQDDLIADAVATGKKVVVVVYSGGEVDMSKWVDKVDAIVMGWYTGQEGGRALADILSGKVSPSGRLPFTFWGSLKKNPSTPYYHVADLDESMHPKHYERYEHYPFADYTEGVFVGYRGIEHFGVKPMFPFGYGLTYSNFKYSDLALEKLADGSVKVAFTVTNTGNANAAEAAQVYVAPLNSKVLRPARELKGFDKKTIAKGQSARYEVVLEPSAFMYYDISVHDWVKDNADFEIQVGSNATDIHLRQTLR